MRRWPALLLAACVLSVLALTLPSAPGGAAVEEAERPRRPVIGDVLRVERGNCTTDGIVRVVHQSWKTADIPAWAAPIAASWDRVYGSRGWRRVLHTDADNRAAVARTFNAVVLEAYDAALPIVRADIARAAYLYEYGGVYADLDVEALSPMDGLLERACREGRHVVLGRMDPPGKRDHEDAIPNAVMAAVRPGEQFWAYCVRQWARRVRSGLYVDAVWHQAGPPALRACLDKWGSYSDVTERATAERPAPGVLVVPPGVWYPYSWKWGTSDQQSVCSYGGLDTERCKSGLDLSKALVMTYWRHSWGR